ncbi:MAG TPA: class I SAM-dependent methyltransferase [Thermomicrobiaceae bacterium]|nr:class I SAM-dependent methyltransferase [Thermomicrobiaceae bacterium]
MTLPETRAAESAYIVAEQPWGNALLAQLYDVFPFDADIPFYQELAGREAQVLELACGTGRVLVPLAAAGHEITGLDASPHMLALARAKLAAVGPQVAERANLVEGDMRGFSLDREFDLAIIAAKSIAYLTDRREQLQALRAVTAHLRPGGRLALDLLHPAPAFLAERPGSLRQDVAQVLADGRLVARTETLVDNDRAAQVRRIRSAYEIVAPDGAVTKHYVEWPYRYLFRFEAEHLLERAGFTVEALYGGYQHEPFVSDSPLMLFVARRAG